MAYPTSMVRAVLNMTSESNSRAYVLHYDGPPGHNWTVGELTSMASALYTAISSVWPAAHAAGVNLDNITCTAPGSSGAPQGTYVPTQPRPGTIAGDMLPANCACCVSWKTGSTNRKARGRTYLLGGIDTMATGSTATPTSLGVFTNFATALLAFSNPGGPGVDLTVYSRLGGFGTEIIAFVINSIMDSQRRRLPGRGR